MRKTIKALVLGCMVVGALAGCEWGKTSQEQSDSRSSAFTSTSEIFTSSSDSSVSTSSTSTSSVPSSSTTSSSVSTSVAPTLTGITLNTENVKKSYILGEALDLTGLVVTANYSDGNNTVVTNYLASPANGSQLNLGNNEITITYQTVSAKFNVFVKQAQSIILNTTNVKTVYEQGEALDLTGLVVTVIYSDNTSAIVTDYTTDPANGTILNEIGSFKVKVTVNTLFQNFDITVNKATKKDWTEEESKIMSDHLNGEVLPFTGFEESVVSYDTTEKMVLIQGGAKEDGYVATYAAKLVAKGYEKYFENANAAGYEKEFSTANGLRHVYVYVGFDNDQLLIQAYDPYVYAFPTAFATQIASYYFDSAVVVPAITADYYLADSDYLCIRCYLTATSDDAGYSALLRTANWTIQPEKDDQGYYIAVSPDQKYAVAYSYFDGALRIYIEPVGFWNSAVINDFFTKYGGEPVNIPALNIEGAQYQFTEWSNNEMAYYYEAYEYIHAFMAIYGAKETDLAKYEAILKEAGWDVINADGLYTATLEIADKGIARIEFSFNTQINGILITIYFKLDPIPEKVFPSEAIAALLGEEVTDVVPAYTGANKGFTVLDDEAGTAVMVYVEGGTELDAVKAYQATLKEAEYTEAGGDAYGDMRYLSKNGQILVTPYYATSGSFTIAFKAAPYLAWPANLIANAFPNAQDTVPVVNDALEYVYQKSGRLINVACTFKNSDDAKAALANYIIALDEAEYTLLGADNSGDPHYDSKNSEFEICPYVASSTLYVSIYGPKESESLWPIDKLTEWYGEEIAKAIPAYDKGSKYEFFESKAFNEIMVTTEDADEAVEEYIAILTTAGFTTTYEDDLGDTHYVKGNIDITPWAEDDTVMDIDIIVTETVVTKWPAQDIASLFSEKGYTDVLPAYNGECDAISAGNNYDGSIYVLIETEDADSLVTAYEALLADSKFTRDIIYPASAECSYTSPNKQYTVTLYKNRFGVEIDITKIDNGGGQQGGESEFPMARVIAVFPGAEGLLPTINDANATFDIDDSFSGEVTVTVNYSSAEAAAEGYNAYIAALTTAGFKEEKLWNYYDAYISDEDRSFAVVLDYKGGDSKAFDITLMEIYY